MSKNIGFASFKKEAEKQGFTAQSASEPAGVHEVVGAEFDKTVTDKDGKPSLLVFTGNGQIRLFQNSASKTIAILNKIVTNGDTPLIAYYFEPRTTGQGVWLRSRVGTQGRDEGNLYNFLNNRPRANTAMAPKAEAPSTPAPVEKVEEEAELPF